MARVAVSYKIAPRTREMIDILAIAEGKTKSAIVDDAVALLIASPDIRERVMRAIDAARAAIAAH